MQIDIVIAIVVASYKIHNLMKNVLQRQTYKLSPVENPHYDDKDAEKFTYFHNMECLW